MVLHVPTAALSAVHGAVIDIPRDALSEGKGKEIVEQGFTQEGEMTRISIKELLRESTDIAVLEIENNGEKGTSEVPFNDLRSGGNALNTATAIARIEQLLIGESGMYVHGPFSPLHQELIERDTGLEVTNPLNITEQAMMPSRISIVDAEAEKYLKYKPKIDGQLSFLVQRGILMPTQNGDLILSSCINSPIFWNQIKDYLRNNPGTQLYFQPGSVHLGKLVENEQYLPKDLMRSGRIVVILNVGEVDGFAQNLEDHSIGQIMGKKTLEILEDKTISLSSVERARAVNTALALAAKGLRDIVITDGPGTITNIHSEAQGKMTLHITKPQDRAMTEATLSAVGINKPSEKVLTTGCGDTFTGAFIALSRLYPHADRNTLMETASLFSAIQTHNTKSNIGNLDLEPLKKHIIEKLGQPNPREFDMIG